LNRKCDIQNPLIIDEAPITLDDVVEVARGACEVELSRNERFLGILNNSRRKLLDAMEMGVPVYGVTTGYGKSCDKRLDSSLALNNGKNLVRFHGCGTGDVLNRVEARAVLICRIASLAQGYSGVTIGLLQALVDLLRKDVVPVIPSEGSVGASGDLTPMSYVAAVLAGEREVFYRGERMPADQALKEAGLTPYELQSKEALAIMNGTTVMTGLAALAAWRAGNLLDAVVRATALSVHAVQGNRRHFHPTISRSRPYAGQVRVSEMLNRFLEASSPENVLESTAPEALQDPYSLRCCPQIAGVLDDTLTWVRQWIEIEINSANDNPLVDSDTGEILMGGNFYGGHISQAMDSLKSGIASVADMCDRQVALLVNPNVNRGLPADLVAERNDNTTHHGFKALSIASSALTAEALKNTMPAASFSRSTESHNQDKVSMGTIAARDAIRILELAARVVSIHILSAVQAVELRGNYQARGEIEKMVRGVRAVSEAVLEDRPLDSDIEEVARRILDNSLFGMDNEQESNS
jgi:histidine ammonia-lyase